MRRRRLIWQIYPSFLAITLIVLLTTGIYASVLAAAALKSQILSDLESRASLTAAFLSSHLTDSDTNEIQNICKRLGLETGVRVTVVAPDGKVIGDSTSDPSLMDNHLDRPEVQAALQNGSGSSQRFSHTLQSQLLYFAVAVKREGQIVAIIRAALPFEPVSALMSSLRWRLALGGIAVALLVVWITFLVARRIARPIEKIRSAAERFSKGDLSERIVLPDSVELAELASTFNRMSQRIREQLTQVSEQRNTLDTVLSSMDEGVLAINAEATIVSLNDSAVRILNSPKNELINRPVAEVIRHSEFQKFVNSVMQSEDPVSEEEIKFRDDSERSLYVHATALKNQEGLRIGVLIVMNDITKLKRLENIRRDFVANVSHELRTPITSIKGFVETLLDGAMKSPEDSKRFLQIIARQCERLNAIIEDLLSLARIEEERTSISRKTVSVGEIIKSAVDVCEYKASQKEIKIESLCSANMQARLNAALVEQALINLVDNAVKYSPSKSTIQVRASQNNGTTTIAVSDNGPGIEKSHLPRLFERFYRVDAGRSRGEGGTGLGLAIVKHIAQSHSGSVEVESVVGKGSTFLLHLSESDALR